MKATILSSVEKFLAKEITGSSSNDDKFAKLKFNLKIHQDEPLCLFDSESSIRCICSEDTIAKAFASSKKNKKESINNDGLYQVTIGKSALDVLFTTDIEGRFILKAVLVIEEFDVDTSLKADKEISQNVNLFAQITVLLKDLYSLYIKNKIEENKFNSLGKINGASFHDKKFEEEPQNVLSFKTDGVYFLYKKRLFIKNPFAFNQDEKSNPNSNAIHVALKNANLKEMFLQNTNFKGVKEYKPSKIDLSKVPSNSYDNEDVDEEYKPFLKQTSLTNQVSSLSKEMFLKHKRRRTNLPKPKGPQSLVNLYNNYQNILANLTVSSIDKFSNMLKYKETISN